MLKSCIINTNNADQSEKRLKWYGRVKRRDEGPVLRRMLDAPVPGKRRRGRQETRWKDSCKRYMESVWLKMEDALDRTKRKNDIYNHPVTPDDGKSPRTRIRASEMLSVIT